MSSTFVPHHVLVGSGAQVGLMLHGVFGAGHNFRAFARRLVERRPELSLLLVDLRHHGQSQGASRPNDVAACADDLHALAVSLGVTPSFIAGHSFGGKVTLRYCQRYPQALEEVWVLDSDPGAQSVTRDHEVLRVHRALTAASGPFKERTEAISALTEQGFSMPLAQWLATSLERTERGLSWRYDLGGIGELLEDYFALDLWPFVETPRSYELNLLSAERSDRWAGPLSERARNVPPEARVRYHQLPDSGHWVHVDNPEGLLDLMSRRER